MTSYVSKIDGKVFDSKEELLDYLELKYVKVEESIENSSYHDTLSKLKNAFPEAYIEVTEVNPNEIHVGLSFKMAEDLVETFNFEISTEVKNTYHQIFEDVESAISFYSLYPNQTELIREKLANDYNLESFEIIRWYNCDAYDTYNYNHIKLEVVLNGKVIDIEMGLHDSFDNIVKYQVEPHFTNTIEGEPVYYDNEREWFIGNYDLNKFLNRANKVKLTIIE